jgi:hypothetical protein
MKLLGRLLACHASVGGFDSRMGRQGLRASASPKPGSLVAMSCNGSHGRLRDAWVQGHGDQADSNPAGRRSIRREPAESGHASWRVNPEYST